ncbi:hypothetical protein T4E_11234 [Trichinella pseudospiralis]|uniref:Uncharacterized protein n=1 Tax=Trichinella pseudospiralis TaxID=6337 RepID=A0A0V0Y3I1_TRIPS|nr:hypothetical protein T4E_11234 [Trichinella pseudospiralis]
MLDNVSYNTSTYGMVVECGKLRKLTLCVRGRELSVSVFGCWEHHRLPRGAYLNEHVLQE